MIMSEGDTFPLGGPHLQEMTNWEFQGSGAKRHSFECARRSGIAVIYVKMDSEMTDDVKHLPSIGFTAVFTLHLPGLYLIPIRLLFSG